MTRMTNKVQRNGRSSVTKTERRALVKGLIISKSTSKNQKPILIIELTETGNNKISKKY